MNIRYVATSFIFCILSFTFPVQASIDKELAMQAAVNGKYMEAIQLFTQHRSSLEAGDYEALMHTNLWLGLAYAAENPNDTQAEQALVFALCAGLPKHYIEEAGLTCKADPVNLITSDLNANMLATGLAKLASQQLVLDEVKIAYRYLFVANKVLLEPLSKTKHAKRASALQQAGKNSNEPHETLGQLMTSLEAEAKKNQQQLISVALAGGKAAQDSNSPIFKNMESLIMRKQITEMLKSGVCRPETNAQVMLMVSKYQQNMGEDGVDFIKKATSLADKMDPEKDCGLASKGSKTKRQAMGLPRKELDEGKMFTRFAEKQICEFNKFNTEFKMSGVVETIANTFSTAMEAKRGTAMKRFNVVRESMIDFLTEYYQATEKLESELSQHARHGRLRSKIATCGENADLLAKLQEGLFFVFSRGGKSIEYYEKALTFALYIQDRNADTSLRASSTLISLRQLLAERYVRAGLNTKAAQQYREIAALMKQGDPHHQELELQPWTSALTSYAKFVQNGEIPLQGFLELAAIVATKQKKISDRAAKLAVMNDNERMQYEMQELIGKANIFVTEASNQMDVSAMLKVQGIVLPAKEMAQANAALGDMQAQIGKLMSPENIAKMMPSMEQFQAELGSNAMQDEFSMDVSGTQVENRWNLLNKNRQFQLGMAQAYIRAARFDDAKQWLARSPYRWEEMQSRYSDKLLAIEGYVTGLYHQARNEHQLASQYFRGAVEHWYFNPVSALDVISRVFPSNTFLLEQAAHHEVQHGDPAIAFAYIEIARQANLGNPRLYGYVSAEKLDRLQKTLEREYTQLLALAERNAAAESKQASYAKALEKSNKQRTKSARVAMGALLPLYTGLDPILPWLKDDDLQGFMKRMETFHTLASNRGLEIYRSKMLVTEKQRQIDEIKKEEETYDTVQLAKSDLAQELDDVFRSGTQSADERISSANILSSSRNVNWLDIESFKDKQKTLNPETAFLSYWLTNENLYVFAINHDRVKTDIFTLDEVYSDIANLNQAYDPKIANDLYLKLIEPYEGMFSKHLVIMTNGALQNVPFAALPYTSNSNSQKIYLGDRYLIRYAPGIEYALDRNPQPQAGNKLRNKLLILAPTEVSGADRLQEARAEAEAIAPLFKTDTFFDDQVTRSLVSEKIPQYSLLHYAGHAKLDEDMPDFSHLILAKDSTGQSSFYVNDIKKLPLQNLQLVVLSACESARTNAFNLNNEFSALNGAFLEAGVASVVASLHVVEDKVTASFMTHFYQKLKNGESKARAIQLAQQYVRENISADPANWAAFILSGQEGYL